MKKNIIIIIIVFLSCFGLKAEWLKIDANNWNSPIFGFHFINEQLGFLYGFNGCYLTTDAGFTWESIIEDQYNTIVYNFKYFGNSEVYFILVDFNIAQSRFIKYDYENKSLDTIISATGIALFDFDFIDENNWICSGRNLVTGDGKIYKTENAGEKWFEIFSTFEIYPDDINDIVVAIKVLNNGDIIAHSYKGHLFKSTDSGSNWQSINIFDNYFFDNQLFVYDNIIIVDGYYSQGDDTYGLLMKSEDYGETWESIMPSEKNLGTAKIFFVNNMEYFLTWHHIDESFLYYTSDGGKTWEIIFKEETSDEYLYGIYINQTESGDIIYIGTSKGNIHLNTNFTNYNEQSDFIQFKIFPNPSSDYLNIDSELIINQLVLSDQLGRVLKTQNENLEQIYIGDLAPGIYLLKIYTSNGEVFAKKVLIQD